MEEEIIKIRKDKIINFIMKKNIYLIGILAFALFIRLYYFFITKDQALWWDALSYGAIAKNYLHGGQWSGLQVLAGEIVIRPKLMSLIWSVLMGFGFTEPMSKIVLQLIPSFFSVLLVYLIVRKTNNEKVALLSAGILSMLWIHIFYSMRILTSIPALFVLLISIFYFVKAEKEIKLKEFALAMLFLSFSTLIRYPFGLMGFVYLFFLLFVHKFAILKKKSFWIGGLIGITPILIFFLLNLVNSGSLFPAIDVYTGTASEKSAYAFYTLTFIPHFFRNPLYLIFILGLIVALVKLVVGFDLIKKNRELKWTFFNILILLFALAFFIFLIKRGEDRYLLLTMLPFLTFTSSGIMFIYNVSKKYSKALGVLLVVLILGWGLYSNITFGNMLINNKKESFKEMKDTFIWMDENLPKGSKVLGETSSLYLIYYTENLIPLGFPKDTIPEDYVIDADYIVVTAYHWHQDYIAEYLEKVQSDFKPVKYGFLGGNEQPSIAVYEYVRN